jgi:hypothetical protein
MILAGMAPVAMLELDRALGAYLHRRGAAQCHPELVEFAASVSETVRVLSLPVVANPVDVAATCSYREAADRIGVSVRTMYRIAAERQLTKVARRLLVVEVDAITRGSDDG